MTLLIRHVLAAFLLVFASSAADANQQQRSCFFNVQVLPDGRYAVNLPVVIATRGDRAKVAVQGSGQYDAAAERFSSGAAEYRFNTNVSREVITVGPGGETAWQIDFNNGSARGYFGTCGPER